MQYRRYLAIPVYLVLLALTGPFVPALAQTKKATPAAVPLPVKEKDKSLAAKLKLPRDPSQPLIERLRSPRETLKTLYFSITTYDVFPQMMEDAVACLDTDFVQSRLSTEDAAMLALDLERILQGLDLPLTTVPDRSTADSVTIYDADNFKIVLRRGLDGGWRFDGETLARVPLMRRLAAERRKPSAQELTGLRDGFTDVRNTLRQFLADSYHGDFYAAARALDLSSLSNDERRERGPVLAQQLGFVMQRRGYPFRQEFPTSPTAPSYTWHADPNGRIVLDRIRLPDGKDAWLFTKQTVRNIPKMYDAVKGAPADPRCARLGLLIPALQDAAAALAAKKRPDDVPKHLGSPRVLLRGFFHTMSEAEANDAKLADALEFLDLQSVPAADRSSLGRKLATKLEAVLRKTQIDLSAVPDDWNAAPQVFGEAQGIRVEVVRGRDGCWRFSDATVARIPEMFEKVAGKGRAENGKTSSRESARDTMIAFQAAASQHQFDAASRCLDLQEIHVSAQDEVGPVLAFKLKYILDRIGRIYVQEIPDEPEGPRFVVYRGDLGRIVLSRKNEDPGKGQWLFTTDTVQRIEAMFRAVRGEPVDESQSGAPGVLAGPVFQEMPGIWIRLKLPEWLQHPAGSLDLYQWLGLALSALLSWVGAHLVLAGVYRVVGWLLHRSGSALSTYFVATKLRPLTWLAALWLFFMIMSGLDLPIRFANTAFALQKFVLAGLVGWLGLRMIDLSMGIYMNSELLRPHRSLSDMIVPVSMRFGKGAVVLIVMTYMIYHVGHIDLLGRFLTGLGVAGLAASLAAQDAMKSFFGTLLLIGERVFKIGDRIIVGSQEGVVEQVGFRSTRLRTAEDSLLTIPNSVIAAAPIDNLGARINHRFSTTVLLGTNTPVDRLVAFRDRLLAWLAEQPHVVHDKVDVHIHRVTEKGVEVNLNLFMAGATGAEELHLREEINCEILRLSDTLDVAVAPVPRKPGESRLAA